MGAGLGAGPVGAEAGETDLDPSSAFSRARFGWRAAYLLSVAVAFV